MLNNNQLKGIENNSVNDKLSIPNWNKRSNISNAKWQKVHNEI